MKKSYFYFLQIFLLCFTIAGEAQDNKTGIDSLFANSLFYNKLYDDGSEIDSFYISELYKDIEKTEGEVKIGLLHKLLNGYYFTQPKLALDLAKRSLDISHQVGNDSLIAFSQHYYALAFTYLKLYRLSGKYYSEALNLSYAKRADDYRSWVSNNLAICFFKLGQLDSAAYYYYNAAKLNERIGNNAFAGKVYGNLGEVFLVMGNYDESIKNYKKSFAYLTEKTDAVVKSENYVNMAKIELIKNNKPEAKKYYDRAFQIVKELNDSSHIVEVCMQYAESLFESGHFEESLEHFKLGKSYCNLSRNKIPYFTAVLGIGKGYLFTGNLSQARKHLFEARDGLTEANAIDLMPELELNLARYYARTGDWDEFNRHFRKSEEDRKVKLEESEISAVNELKIIHETEKKDQELSAQKTRIEYQQMQVWLLIIIAVVLLTGLLISVILRRKLKQAYGSLFEKSREITSKWNQIQNIYKINAKNNLNETKDALFGKINSSMRDDKIYSDPSLNIEMLAKKVNSNIKYVSKAINDNTEMNFSTYVNTFRIEEAKRILLDESTKNWSMDAIVKECGFRNHTSFYQAFRKNTGLTPAVFRDAKLKEEVKTDA